MANEEAQAARSVFAPASTPTIYADAVVNVAHNEQVAKFYLARADPSISGRGEQHRIVSQVVMPTGAFITAYVFFESIVQDMIKQKLLSAESLDRARANLHAELYND